VPIIDRLIPAPPPEPVTDPTQGDPGAAAFRDAVATGDWPAVRAVLAATLDPDEQFLLAAIAAEVDGSEAWLPDAIRADLRSPWPLTLYGYRMVTLAWRARTAARARFVSREQFAVFHDRLRIAEDSFQEAVRLDPGNVPALAELLVTARGLGMGQAEAWRRFERVTHRAPHHRAAHGQMLQQLAPKWGGSLERMHAFALDSTNAAPPGDPLGFLVVDAHFEQRLQDGGGLSYLRSEPVRESVRAAARRSVLHPDYVRRRDWPRAHNAFAAIFAVQERFDLAAGQFKLIGTRMTDFPWIYLHEDDKLAFRGWRHKAYQGAGLRMDGSRGLIGRIR
jgi:hypothetical protein